MTDYISDSEMDQIRACRSASPAQALALCNEVDRLKAELSTARRKAWEAGRDAGARLARAEAATWTDGCGGQIAALSLGHAIAALQPPPEDV